MVVELGSFVHNHSDDQLYLIILKILYILLFNGDLLN